MEIEVSRDPENSLGNDPTDDNDDQEPSSEENLNNEIIVVNEYTYISSADSLFHQELVFSNNDKRIELEYNLLPPYPEENNTIITTMTERDKLKKKLDS